MGEVGVGETTDGASFARFSISGVIDGISVVAPGTTTGSITEPYGITETEIAKYKRLIWSARIFRLNK